MVSLANASTAAASTAPLERITKGPIPARFFALIPDSQPRKAKCMVKGCGAAIGYPKGQGTGSLANHLRSGVHGIENFEKLDDEWIKQYIAKGGRMGGQPGQGTLDSAVIRTSAAGQQWDFLRLVVECNLPFTFPDHPAAAAFMRNCGMAKMSRAGLAQLVTKSYDLSRKNIKNLLCSQLGIALTADHWRSPRGQPLLGVTAHFIDESFTLRTCLLTVQDAPHPHTGEAIARQLMSIVEEFEIEEIIVSITHDNAANMVSAASIFAAALAENGIRPPASIRCVAHTLQLVANQIMYKNHDVVMVDSPAPVESDVLMLDEAEDDADEGDFEVFTSPAPDGVEKVLSSVREVVLFFKRSGPALQHLQATMRQVVETDAAFGAYKNRLPGLLLDVPTRWDSRHTMLSRFCEPLIQRALSGFANYLFTKIDLAAQNERAAIADLRERFLKLMEPLPPVRMCEINELARLLGEIKAATAAVSKSSSVTSSSVVRVLSDTYSRIKQAPILSTFASHAKGQILDAFKKYWEGLDDALVIAIACDPVNLRFERSMPALVGLEKRALELMTKLLSSKVRVAGSGSESESSDDEARLRNREPVAFQDLGDATKPLRTSKRPADYDVLKWWQSEGNKHPACRDIARKYLCMQASSAPCERVFSLTSYILGLRRTRMSAENLNALACLKSWLALHHDMPSTSIVVV